MGLGVCGSNGINVCFLSWGCHIYSQFEGGKLNTVSWTTLVLSPSSFMPSFALGSESIYRAHCWLLYRAPPSDREGMDYVSARGYGGAMARYGKHAYCKQGCQSCYDYYGHGHTTF